jgi:hypothetical protein
MPDPRPRMESKDRRSARGGPMKASQETATRTRPCGRLGSRRRRAGPQRRFSSPGEGSALPWKSRQLRMATRLRRPLQQPDGSDARQARPDPACSATFVEGREGAGGGFRRRSDGALRKAHDSGGGAGRSQSGSTEDLRSPCARQTSAHFLQRGPPPPRWIRRRTSTSAAPAAPCDGPGSCSPTGCRGPWRASARDPAYPPARRRCSGLRRP